MSPANAAEQLGALIEAGERDLAEVIERQAEGAELAGEVGGDLAFRWRLLELRAALVARPQDDSVAERYGELVEAARGDDARLAAVSHLGDQIRALQDSGELPRAMLARTRRRPQP